MIKEEEFKTTFAKYLPEIATDYTKKEYDSNYINTIAKLLKGYKGDIHELIEYYNNTFEDPGSSHYTPKHVIKTMLEIANIKEHETVADYFGGTAKILEQAPKCKHNYFNDIYGLECTIAKLVLRNKTNTTFYHEDFFEFEFPKVDVIVTNIPFLTDKENTLILNKIKELCKRAVLIVPIMLKHADFKELQILSNDTFTYTNVNSKIVGWQC